MVSVSVRSGLDVVELEDVTWIGANNFTCLGKARAVVTQKTQQRDARLARVDAPIDQHPGAFVRRPRMSESHPAH